MGEHRPPCNGSVHVIAVPPGMTPGEAWAEGNTLGRMAPYRGEPTWAVMECPGGDECVCRFADVARAVKEHHNGRLIGVTILGLRVPRWLLWPFTWSERERGEQGAGLT